MVWIARGRREYGLRIGEGMTRSPRDGDPEMRTLTLSSLWTMILAGAVATVAFDFFGQSLSPMLGFASLAPVPLANSVIKVLTGAPHEPSAQLLHYLAGMIAYPFGWMFIAEPLARRITPNLSWLAVAVLYGVALWIFALFVMAHLIAGLPAFLGFTGITWIALAGHVLFAVVAAMVVRWREGAAGHAPAMA
jgi:CDP-diglyceride synthetase